MPGEYLGHLRKCIQKLRFKISVVLCDMTKTP